MWGSVELSKIMTAPRLRIVAVGTGRDGTQSLYHMVQELLTDGRTAMHEYGSREIYRAFCRYRETADQRFLEDIRTLIRECPYDCIIGNGYAAILPLVAELCGPEVTIIHLRRADRAACIRSLAKNCELFPTAYKYYSAAPEATFERMAAFHFGEMERERWSALSMYDKLAWYYDKTHRLIEENRNLFSSYFQIETERLDDLETRELLAKAILGTASKVVPDPIHLNAHAIDISTFPIEYRFKMFWLLGRLDFKKLARDDVYGVDYFLDKFIAWIGYQITDAPQLGSAARLTTDEIEAILKRASSVLLAAEKEVQGLQDAVRRANSE